MRSEDCLNCHIIRPCFLWYFKIDQIFIYVKIKINVDLFRCGSSLTFIQKTRKEPLPGIYESQFNIRMCSVGTCKTSLYSNLVTSYGFQLGQNHWTWIWIYSLHTAEECWISTQCVVRVLQRIPLWPHG